MKRFIGEIKFDDENGDRCVLDIAMHEDPRVSALHSDRIDMDLCMQAISLPFWGNLAGLVVSIHQVLPVSLFCFALGCVLLVLTCGLTHARQSLITFGLLNIIAGKPYKEEGKPTETLLRASLVLWAFGVSAFVAGVLMAI